MANNEDPDQMPHFAASDIFFPIYGTLEKMCLYQNIQCPDTYYAWLVWLNDPLRQYFSLYMYRAVSQREGERKEI